MKPYGYLITVRNQYSDYKPSYRYGIVKDLLEYSKINIMQSNANMIDRDCIVHSIPIETEEEYNLFREII